MTQHSKTPLLKKLGIKKGMRLHLVDVPEDYFQLLGPLPKDVNLSDKPPYDFIHFFVNMFALFENSLMLMKNEISQDGMIWVSWYKQSSDKHSELTEDIIRNTALGMGLVDVKVCAIDEDWSGLKLVMRKH